MAGENLKEQTGQDRFWTIPNVLSIARVFMIIPIVDNLKTGTPVSNFEAFIWIAVAYFTDFLDGFLARTFKTTSKVGQILDPIGDKVLAVTVSAVLYILKQAPLYFFVLIFLRDVIISMGAIYAMNKKRVILLPLLAGKITTFVLGIVLAFYPLKYSFLMSVVGVNEVIEKVVEYGTYLASFLLIVSGIFYVAYYVQSFLVQKKAQSK